LIEVQAFVGKTGNGDWADMLAEMDHNVGEMLDAVDRLAIRVDWAQSAGAAA
jgi:hypothetical protein